MRMAKGRIGICVVAGLAIWLGGAAAARAQTPPPADVLKITPKQAGVPIGMPTPDEIKLCEVKLEQGKVPGSSGWVLLDGKKQPLRRFADTNGDKKIDIWSYYKDGVEVYREVDTNKNDKADQYRWLNSAGAKWGIDYNEDGKIDAWRVLSPEEAAQEVFLAVQTRDLARLQAVMLTEAEMKALKLPQADIDRYRDNVAKAAAKFKDTCDKAVQLNDKATFVRAEGPVPTCVPADSFGGDQDLFRYTGRAILYEGADKKHDWIQTGPMVQYGLAWRVVDAPVPGDLIDGGTNGGTTGTTNLAGDPAIAGLVKELSDLDKSPVPAVEPGKKNDAAIQFNLKRVQIIEQIIAKVTKAEERENFVRQMSDNLASAYQAGDTASLAKLDGLRDQTVKAQAGSLVAGYVAFRRIWAEYAVLLVDPAKNTPKVQEQWMDQLSKFVQAYPKAEDAPDALLHLAMGSEFNGKDDEAKRWYQQLTGNFPAHALTPKAAGAIRRLDSVGQPLQLTGPTLAGGAYDITKSAGKVVAVYYWASYCDSCIGDFARLKHLQTTYGSKGLEIVSVNLDDRKADAEKYLTTNALPVTHLFQADGQAAGLNSPLATHYGILGLPHLFLVGKDGRVISRTLQMNNLEDAIKKAIQ